MYQVRLGPPLSNAIKQLIIINAAVFILDISIRIFLKSDFIIYYFALTPELIVTKLFIWQILTYQFLHGGIFHILFNMLALWMFGSELEVRWGKRNFLKFYLITGTMTGVMIFLFNYMMGYNIPTIGASGVVFAIMVAYAVYWGNRMIYIWMVIPIRVKYFVMIMGVISFVSMISPGQSGISHIGHLGGIISGYLYLKLFMDGQFSGGSGGSGISFFKKIQAWKKKREWEKKSRERYDNMNTEQIVDEILAKISRTGLKSLSRNEKQFLKKASEKMNENMRH